MEPGEPVEMIVILEYVENAFQYILILFEVSTGTLCRFTKVCHKETIFNIRSFDS